MKKTLVVVVGLMLLTSTSALAKIKPCDELKSEIDQKLQAKGLKACTLQVVPVSQVKDQKVLGSCGGGKEKIIYTQEKAK